MEKETKQTKIPTLGAEKTASLEDKLKEVKAQEAELRKQELELFQNEFKTLSEKYGFAFSPVITISTQGVVPNLEIIATR